MVLALVAGSSALAYARWTRPAADADAALADGRYDEALASYARAETRFDRLAAAKEFFAADYGHVMASQLWLLYRLQRYDETIDKAQRAPEGALQIIRVRGVPVQLLIHRSLTGTVIELEARAHPIEQIPVLIRRKSRELRRRGVRRRGWGGCG